jgi:hypothetical protein
MEQRLEIFNVLLGIKSHGTNVSLRVGHDASLLSRMFVSLCDSVIYDNSTSKRKDSCRSAMDLSEVKGVGSSALTISMQHLMRRQGMRKGTRFGVPYRYKDYVYDYL